MTFGFDGRAARPSRLAFGSIGLALATAALLSVSCSAGGTSAAEPATVTGPTSATRPAATTGGATVSAPGPAGNLSAVRVELQPIANLEQPLAIAVRPGDPALYVAEKVGRVVAVTPGAEPRTVLDLTGRVSLGSEQGLLGLVFSPDGRYLYVDFTDVNGDTRVSEFHFVDRSADASSRREILFVHQPFSNHNGGELEFGPDGYLYIGLGDGGSGGDPYGNGQSRSTLLGKILRISPRPSDGEAYGIPKDNPFVGTVGAKPEIWDYGLRNPWRFSFDRQTGDLWIGDVGQVAWEEIDVEPAGSPGGLNFGWNRFEGPHPYQGGGDAAGITMPVYEYPHDGGVCSVTGGYVYRGSAIPDLAGAYVFGDYCDGNVEAFVLRDGQVTGRRLLGPRVDGLASFGEDAEGELYVCALSGQVSKLVPAD